MSEKLNHWFTQRNYVSWVYKWEDHKRASVIYDTQKEALEAAKNSARKDNSEVMLKGRDGKIRENNCNGNDLFLPKG